MPAIEELVSKEALESEAGEKQSRLAALFDEQQISALLVRQSQNIAWATSGKVDARVLIPSDTWATSLLLTKDGKKYYLAPKNEAPRLAAEEFAGLGYEPVLFPWYDENWIGAVQKIAGSVEVGTDVY